MFGVCVWCVCVCEAVCVVCGVCEAVCEFVCVCVCVSEAVCVCEAVCLVCVCVSEGVHVCVRATQYRERMLQCWTFQSSMLRLRDIIVGNFR